MDATQTAIAIGENLTFVPMAVALQHPACASPRPGKKPHKSKLYRWVAAGLVRHEYRGRWLFICVEDLEARRRPGRARAAARSGPVAAAERKEQVAEQKRSEEWTRTTLEQFYGRRKPLAK